METDATIALSALAAALVAGCADEMAKNGDTWWDAYSPDTAFDTGYDGGLDSGAWPDATADTLPPPEDEVEADFKEPRASGRYVFVANSAEDYVVVIDSKTLSLEIVNVGRNPLGVATHGLVDAAMVINQGSRDVSIIRKSSLTECVVNTLPSVRGLDRIEIAPTGASAVLFHDFDLAMAPADGVLDNFQDVVIVDMGGDEDASFTRTCGYMPREVEFDDSGENAFIVTRAGISRVEFDRVATDPDLLPTMPYPPGVAEMVTDVDIDPKGTMAIVRLDVYSESTSVWIMDLVHAEHHEIVLPAIPYDLDLSPAGDFAVAVMPTISQVALIQLPWSVTVPYQTFEVVGLYAGQAQVSDDGTRIALFSNQSGEERIGVFDVEARTLDVFRLYKKVETVAFTPDDSILAVIHAKEIGPALDPTDYEDVADHSYGYSLVRVSDGYVKQQLTDAHPEPFLVHPDGSRIYLLQRMDSIDVREVQVIYTDTFVVSTLKLGSPPVSIGYVPDSDKMFVSQEHSSGRITFMDKDENMQTITGFELNDWIVE